MRNTIIALVAFIGLAVAAGNTAGTAQKILSVMAAGGLLSTAFFAYRWIRSTNAIS